ncbi:uncharacterized protein N0V89_006839 [Didymosphaeria variabile]|uniref:RRM domain-containing protein n=1 Tax=Didymosphaeria variabile TaxID=1932322 RepID=A0A9W8XIZ6_9PLEO|nr:uncharacterized protein N0V89_006839 [Didymosphaeria variabile]KAJ4351496.1 hypothetical protein N0V89_006839 [Didymosphaeria variabile]
MSANSRQNYPTATGYKSQMMGHGHYNQGSQGHGTANYLHRGHMSPQTGDNGMAGLANGLAAMNVHGSYGGSMTSKAGAVLPGNASEYGGLPINQGQLWVPNMNPMYGVMAGAQQQSGMTHSPGIYNHTGTFVPQNAYAYAQGMVDSPMGNGWASRVSSGDMPTLMTPRRDSISSNENDIPGTPYTSAGLYRYGTSTAIMDRSPNGMYTSSATPSPSQLAQYGVQLVNPKQASVATISPQLAQILQKEPPIPRAIPAPSSPLKPLDRSLENKTGETNVYIRGLLPETTDEMLHAWGKRFGDIQSSKSIIDLKTNLCKGFGFIKFHNFEDAENCIRGFHYLGYEVSFARESFYSKLKKFADESNTNLYVSNIPKNMSEHELSAIFAPHKVCSTRILRDPSGHGRGVGFARFETRDICEEVIKTFNNTPVAKPGGDEHLIQIRYSDTHEQKMLKQQTAAGRVFRAAEYEVGVAQARALTGGPDRYMSMSPDSQGAANEFEIFLQQQSTGNPTSYGPATNRYRQPWTPAVPSSLGMSRPAMHQMAHAPVFKVEDGGSERGTDVKTNPATPIKQEASSSPSRHNGDE